MPDASAVAAIDLLQREMASPDTQWSLGTFGAIQIRPRPRRAGAADAIGRHHCSRDAARRHCAETAPEQPTVGLREHHQIGLKSADRVCLPANDCAMSGRNALTEVGADHDALRPEDRQAILFDLGLGA